MRHLPHWAGLLAVTLPATVAAEEATPPVTTDITVTARPVPLAGSSSASAREDVRTTPGGAEIVERDVIARSRTATLRDVLGASPGVIVQPRFGSEEARLSIRGSGLQRTFHLRGVMLLQDGQPLNQADGAADFQAIDPALASHITIHRGANALADGASTLGGAIDFASPTGIEHPGIRARAEGGSFAFAKGLAAAAGSAGPLDAAGAFSASRQDGFREHSHQRNRRATGNLGWRILDRLENRLWLSAADSDSQLPGSLTRTQMDADPRQANAQADNRDTKRDYPLYRIADRLALDWDDSRLELGGGWQYKDLYHPLSFGEIDQRSEDWTATLRLVSHTEWFGRGNRLVLGINGVQGRTDATTYAYIGRTGHLRGALTSDALQRARGWEPYGEIQHELVSGWWGVMGAQYVSAQRTFEDHFLRDGDQSGSRTWTSLNPKFGMRWEYLPAASLYANVSRSSEAPTFAEYVARDPSGATRPQQDMAAQHAWTAELGSRGVLERASWDLSAYHAWLRDEYLSYQVAPGLSQTINADRTLHFGVESRLDLAVVRGLATVDDRLVLANTYTWGRFRFDGDPVYGNNQLPGLPEHSWRGELRWELRGWYAGPVLEAQSGWPVDFANQAHAAGVLLLGARAGYRGPAGVSGFIEGRNLAGTTYAATTGIAAPNQAPAGQELFNPGDGRSVVAGLEWSH
ncbi:MAG: TonB-dependent receptor [Planctomycetes bacterium]|nr:TonB-dependent receptor [Planctomycetota bacterium]